MNELQPDRPVFRRQDGYHAFFLAFAGRSRHIAARRVRREVHPPSAYAVG